MGLKQELASGKMQIEKLSNAAVGLGLSGMAMLMQILADKLGVCIDETHVMNPKTITNMIPNSVLNKHTKAKEHTKEDILQEKVDELLKENEKMKQKLEEMKKTYGEY